MQQPILPFVEFQKPVLSPKGEGDLWISPQEFLDLLEYEDAWFRMKLDKGEIAYWTFGYCWSNWKAVPVAAVLSERVPAGVSVLAEAHGIALIPASGLSLLV